MITGGLLLCCVPVLHGQSLKGKLFGTHAGVREILPQGFVQWIGQDSLVRVNENGVFELSLTGITDRRLVAGGPYQQTDTIAVGDRTYLSITLREAGAELSGVTVKDQRGAYVSTRTIGQTEVVTRRELTKAACCDLAGCFGTQASVQPQTTNVVTNAQELRILGLSGVYNQVLIDGLPTITGMSYTYGISTYPGTVVDNIFISKGTTSVLQGYEAISGQINLQTSQANNAERLHLNGYINNFGEKHLNVQVASPVGRNKKWHSLLALHTVQPAGKIDRNDDGFMDLPQLTRYMAFNKWQYGNEQQKGLAIQAGLRFVREQRIGGQMNYASPSDEGSTQVYGQSVRYDQAEATLKMAYRFSEKHALVFSTAGLWHDQHSWFGVTKYDARQQTGYLNLQHEWRWHARHVLKYGLSYRYQELKEQVRFSDNSLQRSFAGNYSTPLRVPGVFAENTCNWLNDKWSLITGFRTDRHQQWGWYGTPRAMIRYQSGAHTLRASAGSGWR
jgi:outer membrane cobalamin receptor